MTETEEPMREKELRHLIADVLEQIEQLFAELNRLENKRTALENELYISRHNRGAKQ